MDTGQTCDVCQSTNFFEENGQYWCTECNTMSQYVTAVLVDQGGPTAPEVNEDFDQTDDSMSEFNYPENLTSFELLTKVLRGLALELIDLGVSSELYKVSKILWLTYLKKCGIILNKHKQPVLPALLNKNDIEILYGVQGVTRKKIITGSSKSPRSKVSHSRRTSTSSISKNRQQRKLMQQLMLEDEGNVSTIQSLQEPLSPASSRNSSDYETDEEKIRDIKLVKGAKRFLKKKRALYHRKDLKHSRLIPSISYSSSIEMKKMHIGAVDVLSVLWVALQYTSSSYLQLSDLYRLVTDGYLNLDNIERFVPGKHRNYLSLRYWFKSLTRRSFLVRCGTSCKIMEMTHVRTCDIRVVIRRYVAELALPEDILQFTDLMCQLSSPPLTLLAPLSSRLMPEYDLIAMAILLVTLKALFGLDDATEVELSRVAKKINKRQSASAHAQFDWVSWSQYIECRSAVIGSVHNVTFESTYSRLLSHKLAARSAGIKSDRQVKDNLLGGSKRLKPVLLAGLNSACQEMKDSTGEQDSQVPIKPPLAVKPDEAYLPQWTKEILSRASHTIHPKARRILECDFTQTSLEFLNPTKFTELCTRRGLSSHLHAGRSPRAPAHNSVPMHLFLGAPGQQLPPRVLARVTRDAPRIKEEMDALDVMLAADDIVGNREDASETMDDVDMIEDARNVDRRNNKRNREDATEKMDDVDMIEDARNFDERNIKNRRNDADTIEDNDARNVDRRNNKNSRDDVDTIEDNDARNVDKKNIRNMKNTRHENSPRVENSSDTLTLLIPWHQYWVVNYPTLLNLHGTRYKYLYKHSRLVSRSIASLCPVNFVWLLNQCASIVRSQPYHLYASMCLLEHEILCGVEETRFWPNPRHGNEPEKPDGSGEED